MKPPVEAPTSRQSSPATSTPSASSAFASFSPPRETKRGPARDVELGGLVHLLARLRMAGNAAREHEGLRLGAGCGQPTLDQEDIQPLLHVRQAYGLGRPALRRVRVAP